MMAQDSTSGKSSNFLGSKDMEFCVMLLSQGLYIQHLDYDKRTGKTKLFFDKKEAERFDLLWRTGQPIPISDIRDVFNALRKFNAAIHSHQHHSD